MYIFMCQNIPPNFIWKSIIMLSLPHIQMTMIVCNGANANTHALIKAWFCLMLDITPFLVSHGSGPLQATCFHSQSSYPWNKYPKAVCCAFVTCFPTKPISFFSCSETRYLEHTYMYYSTPVYTDVTKMRGYLEGTYIFKHRWGM